MLGIYGCKQRTLIFEFIVEATIERATSLHMLKNAKMARLSFDQSTFSTALFISFSICREEKRERNLTCIVWESFLNFWISRYVIEA